MCWGRTRRFFLFLQFDVISEITSPSRKESERDLTLFKTDFQGKGGDRYPLVSGCSKNAFRK